MVRWGEGGDYNYRNQDGGGRCGGKSAPDRNERHKGQAGSGITMAGSFDENGSRATDKTEGWTGSNLKKQGMEE